MGAIEQYRSTPAAGVPLAAKAVQNREDLLLAWDLPAVDCEWRAEYRSVLPAFCDGERSEGGEGSERLEELHS